jgi:hypothetical protein
MDQVPNVSAPFGFRPIGRVDSAAWAASLSERQISNADTTAIGQGDAVKALSTGFITRATAADNALADPGIFGVFWGCEYFDNAINQKVFSPQWPGITTAVAGSIRARVIADPNVLFEVQAGGSVSVGVVTADIGANVGILNGAVNAQTGQSTQGIDVTTINTTVTLPFRIVNISPKIGLDNVASAYNQAIVKLNNAALNSRIGF